MADANQGYELAEAVDFARRVAGLGLRWFEEPCRWTNDRRCMRDVRYQAGVSVCAGQSETTLRGLRDLVMDGAIDVSNFDASWAGGPTIWRKAAGLCAAFGVELGHHEEPQVSSHLLASVPNHTFTECFDEERDPFFWRLTDMSTRIAGGRYRLPDRPASASNSTGTTFGHTPWRPAPARDRAGGTLAGPHAGRPSRPRCCSEPGSPSGIRIGGQRGSAPVASCRSVRLGWSRPRRYSAPVPRDPARPQSPARSARRRGRPRVGSGWRGRSRAGRFPGPDRSPRQP